MNEKRVASVVTVPIDRLGPEAITPGYAMTANKGQGGSAENTYLLLGLMTNMQMGYVQTTRGKRSTRLFIDKHHAGDDLKALVADLKRSRTKKLAHDLLPSRPKLSVELRIET